MHYAELRKWWKPIIDRQTLTIVPALSVVHRLFGLVWSWNRAVAAVVLTLVVRYSRALVEPLNQAAG